MTHDVKGCMEGSRKLDAKHSHKHIAPDEKLEQFELSFEGKRDRWNGYDAAAYSRVIDSYELRDEARQKYLKQQQLKKLTDMEGEDGGLGEMTDEDDAKVDDSEQMDFAKVEKRVRTTGGGSTGSVRNLRIREDATKYLLNLDVNSAYYNPKTGSVREDPNPGSDANDRFYMVCTAPHITGDNHNRLNGQASKHPQLKIHAWEAYEKGQDVHMQAAPSQAELLHREFKRRKNRIYLVLDKKKLKEALTKEAVRSNEEKDERKRKYNVVASVEVTAEELEAYLLQKSHYDNPMKGYLDGNNVLKCTGLLYQCCFLLTKES
eukprot:SM000056S17977  [mRNA]  locus=s56:432163:435467:+ [translate_table: standard]